jgi:glycosyltransferase involved in cell wall biosynthesis
MRIMHIAETLSFGGLETQLITLCREFIRLGHQPFIFSMVMSPEFQSQLDQAGIDYIVEPTPGGKTRNYIAQNGIQVLHGHPAATLYVGTTIGAELNLPVVITYHGLYGWAWQVHKSISHFVCVSQEVYDKLSPDPLAAGKATVIQNGIDCSIFQPSGTGGTGHNILFIGRLDPDKYHAVKIVINALSSLPNIELSVAGSGPYFDQLRLEAPGFVKCLGYIADMPEVINRADIVIGTGRGIREAMACGKPAIALDACGYDGLVTPETIVPLEYQNFSGRSGRQLNQEYLLQDILKIIDNPAARAEIGQWSRQYALEHYSSTTAALKHLVIYNQLITNNT